MRLKLLLLAGVVLSGCSKGATNGADHALQSAYESTPYASYAQQGTSYAQQGTSYAQQGTAYASQSTGNYGLGACGTPTVQQPAYNPCAPAPVQPCAAPAPQPVYQPCAAPEPVYQPCPAPAPQPVYQPCAAPAPVMPVTHLLDDAYPMPQYYHQPAESAPCVPVQVTDCGRRISRFSLEAAMGPEYFVGGKAVTGDQINPIPGITSENKSMSNAYDEGHRYELGASYALSPNRKVTLMGSYAKAKGDNINFGVNLGEVVTGTLSDYERYGAELGLRQYFAPKRFFIVKSLRPYMEARLGAAKVKDIDIEDARVDGAVFNGGVVPFYEGGWVPTAAGLVGFETPVTRRATLGVETGLRYTGKLKSSDGFFGPGTPLAGTNNGSESLTVPVMLRGRYRF